MSVANPTMSSSGVTRHCDSGVPGCVFSQATLLVTGGSHTAACALDPASTGRPNATTVSATSRATHRRGRWRPAYRSVSTRAPYHGERRLPEDHEVESQRPVLHIAKVQPDRLVPGEITATADLPQTGEAGLDQQPAA